MGLEHFVPESSAKKPNQNKTRTTKKSTMIMSKEHRNQLKGPLIAKARIVLLQDFFSGLQRMKRWTRVVCRKARFID